MACCTGLCLCTSDECKSCRACKDRCAEFAMNSDLEKACKRGCEADSDRYYTVDEFLSGTEGYQSPEDLLNQARTDAQIDATREESTNRMIKIIGGILLIMMIILVAFLILRKRGGK